MSKIFSQKIKGRPFYNLKLLWYDIQCFFERGRKGYCWRDVMNVDYYLLRNLPEILNEYNTKRNGYPGFYVIDYPDLSDDERDEKWGKYIDEIILHLRNGLEETCDQENEFTEEFIASWKNPSNELAYNELRKKYHEREKELSEYRLSEARKGFEMLGDRFFSFWY